MNHSVPPLVMTTRSRDAERVTIVFLPCNVGAPLVLAALFPAKFLPMPCVVDLSRPRYAPYLGALIVFTVIVLLASMVTFIGIRVRDARTDLFARSPSAVILGSVMYLIAPAIAHLFVDESRVEAMSWLWLAVYPF